MWSTTGDFIFVLDLVLGSNIIVVRTTKGQNVATGSVCAAQENSLHWYRARVCNSSNTWQNKTHQKHGTKRARKEPRIAKNKHKRRGREKRKQQRNKIEGTKQTKDLDKAINSKETNKTPGWNGEKKKKKIHYSKNINNVHVFFLIPEMFIRTVGTEAQRAEVVPHKMVLVTLIWCYPYSNITIIFLIIYVICTTVGGMYEMTFSFSFFLGRGRVVALHSPHRLEQKKCHTLGE